MDGQIGRLACVALLALVGMYLIGCGGSDETSSTAVALDKAATTPSAPSGPLASEEARLDSAGYRTASEEVSGGAAAGLSVEPPGASIDYYADPDRAAVAAEQLENVFDQKPGRGEVSVHGSRVYWIAEEHPLTAKERAAFARMVAVAERSR